MARGPAGGALGCAGAGGAVCGAAGAPGCSAAGASLDWVGEPELVSAKGLTNSGGAGVCVSIVVAGGGARSDGARRNAAMIRIPARMTGTHLARPFRFRWRRMSDPLPRAALKTRHALTGTLA